MTQRERFIKTLKCEPIGGQVPTFELVFFLTMEAFGRVHPSQRYFGQWNQMSKTEQNLHIQDMADLVAIRDGLEGVTFYPIYVMDLSTIHYVK